MCGVVAVFEPDGNASSIANRLDEAIRTMFHRGPDGAGLFARDRFGIGMTRLAIIDTFGSPQPLFNETRSLAWVCNGEIYNYRELRTKLMSRGHVFRTEGDCEVIGHLYEEFGSNFAEHLRGMFSIAIFDTSSQKLILARDRLGLKPLYWARFARGYAFASEIRALVAIGASSLDLHNAALLGYLRHSFSIHREQSLLRDVKRFPPATVAELSEDGLEFTSFWHEPVPTRDGSVLETPNILRETIDLHLHADVPSAFLVSGGVDSQVITALSHQRVADCLLLTARYSGRPQADESEAASHFANRIGLPITHVPITDADISEQFQVMSSSLDEPAADPSSVIQWILYRFARSLGCRVVQTGIGGDELFLGYPLWNKLGMFIEAMPKGARELFGHLEGFAAPGRSQEENLLSLNPSALSRARLLKELRNKSRTYDSTNVSRTTWRGIDDVYKTLREIYLTNNGLLLGDKIGMASSVEVRIPLSDHVLLEQVLSIPLERRVPRTGYGKPILRDILQEITGMGWNQKKKQGFEIPSNLLRQLVIPTLSELRESTVAAQLFDPIKWHNLVDDFEKRNGNTTPIAARKRDRRHRIAWISGLAQEPDTWTQLTLIFAVLSVERSLRYWSGPPKSILPYIVTRDVQ